MKNALIATLVLAGFAATTAAQTKVDERRPAAPDGTVEIENPAGAIRVVGWDKAEVAVTGTLGVGADGIEVAGKPARVRVEVRATPDVKSEIEVKVPAGSRVEVESIAASLSVTGVTGVLNAQTVSGGIAVAGGTKEAHVQTVSGAIELSGACPKVYTHSVSGQVVVKGASGEIDAATVSGQLTVTDGKFGSVKLGTVSGRLLFDADLAASGRLGASSVSGAVTLVLPAAVSAEFSVTSFSGEILNELGPEAKRAAPFLPSKELKFSTGTGGARVSVETVSGSVSLKKK
jgi:DUF4097 and DUF4098 domain-containing protein YvlB